MSDLVTVTCAPCVQCGQRARVQMTEHQLRELRAGTQALRMIFPTWTPGELELLITGTHAVCWDEMFAEKEEA